MAFKTNLAALPEPNKPTDSIRSKPNKPKKPLTAYNLFYRYKRVKIIEANGADKEAICRLVSIASGLEDYLIEVPSMTPSSTLDAIRRANIKMVVGQQLLARDTAKRPHRKTSHGYSMSFVEMNKLMVENWRMCDELAKSVFQELADEGRKLYQVQLIDYFKKLADNNKEANVKLSHASAKAMSPGITYIDGSSLGSSKLDMSWEPLPFKNIELPKASLSKPTDHTVPEVDMPPMTGTIKRTLGEGKFDQYRYHNVQYLEDFSCRSPCISTAIVKPILDAKPSVRPTIMDRFEAIHGIIEPIPHLVTPSCCAFPFAMHLPLYVGTDSSSGSACADFELIMSNHIPDASVDDFMELVAALDES